MNRPPIRNLVEDHAVEAYTKLARNFSDFCGCEMCRVDVLVYALNRIPARYVSGLEGTVVTDVNL
ncbi:MAG TPA: late competence development ComFB family protein, partial [Gemmatimonadales bacterium]|nr:late competence development ComFB family protein [Gemmatimonadales bacterium]